MVNYQQYGYDGDDTDEGQFPGETPAMKQLREKAEADSKRIKDLQTQLETFAMRERERSLAEVITAKGLDQRVGKLIPKDADSPEKVEAWLSEYGELFASKAGVN